MRCRIAVVVFGFFAAASLALADENAVKATALGSISGVVKEPDGAVAAKVSIRLFEWDDKRRGNVGLREETKTDEAGLYNFLHLPDGTYTVAAQSDAGQGLFNTILQDGQQQKFDIVLEPAVAAVIQLKDEAGQPIAGARLRNLQVHSANGRLSVWGVHRDAWGTLGLANEPSDAAGQLHLPALPKGSELEATIDQSDFAPVKISKVTIESGIAATAVMHPGVKLTFRIAPASGGKSVSEVTLKISHSDYENPSQINRFFLPISAEGTAAITVEPGQYDVVQLEHDDYLITPTYRRENAFDSFEIAPGRNDTFEFQLRRKVKASGRVVDAATGKPLTDVWVIASVPNPPATDWGSGGDVAVDAEGRFTLKVPVGPVRLSTLCDNYTLGKAYLETKVEEEDTTLSDIKLVHTPTITGRVVDAEGKPVAGAVVRLRGIFSYLRHAPAKSDKDGLFELPVARMPEDFDSHGDELAWMHPLDAFHPTEPLSAQVVVHLDKAESYSNLTIPLKKESYEEFLERAKAPTTDWARKVTAMIAESQNKQRAAIGRAAPELDGAVWINTDKPKMSLTDFRGKYVLLDFWAVWCGPCHADFPEIKMLHELFKDHGLVVIGVHNNSVDADSVREHAKQQHLEFPIVVDQRDGRILTAYNALGLVNGFPGYVLIGPDGKIAETETRRFQMEYARKFLFSGGKP